MANGDFNDEFRKLTGLSLTPAFLTEQQHGH